MYSGLGGSNPIDGLPSKADVNKKLTKEEKKALKQKKKEEEKRKKEEEKRKKEEQKRKEKEEKEAKKRLEKELKAAGGSGQKGKEASVDAGTGGNNTSLKRSGSSKDLSGHSSSTIARQPSNSSVALFGGGGGEGGSGGGSGPYDVTSSIDSPRSHIVGLSSSQSGIDKRHNTVNQGGSGTPKLTRTKSTTSGALGKVQAKKGRRPAKFKEKEFQLILENLRQNNKQDTELDLQNHHLDKWAAEELAEVLIENKTVNLLNLSHNLIGDEGVVHIARMLEKNKTIRSLDISFNGLTRKGTRHIINCLNNNVFITELFMEEETIELGSLGLGNAQLDAITPGMRTEIELILESNEGFQLLLAGKSDKLELPSRMQSYINTHIIDRFPGLRKIDLSENKLRSIPREIGSLKKLEELKLNDNRIESIPVEIGELESLEVLTLSSNQITEIPLALTNLPRLRRLELADNKLDHIPWHPIGVMPELQSIDIRDNPLSKLLAQIPSLRDEINKGGIPTLKHIKEELMHSDELFKMKLMFVGNGNVGKTTLMSNLANYVKDDKATTATDALAAPVVPAQPVPKLDKKPNVATDGIDIRNWIVKHPTQDKSTIDFSCWDFAGQEVYYATHGFFLTTRAIYLLIFNLLESEETSQIEYWLQSIGARTENAPVILVGTHAEDKACTKEYVDHYFNSIYQKYGSRFKTLIQAHFAISNETQKGMLELKNRIVELALAQPYMPQLIPRVNKAIGDKLQGLAQTRNPPTLEWTEYERIAIEVGNSLRADMDGEKIKSLTRFLNDMGSLVWFSDAALRDLVIIDPQWITKTFATVVSLKFGFIKDGILLYKDLPQLWKPPTHPTYLHPKLVAMLEKLQVISRLTHDSERILIPCLLPDKIPEDVLFDKHWPLHEDIPQAGRVYNFEFVPLGFFSRLIVRFLASETFEPLLYWKQGIVVSKETERIKLSIRKNPKHKTMPWCLELWVRGPKPARHLTKLVDNIDTLAYDWLRVKPEITVPCVHCIKERSPDPYQFPLSLIEKAVTVNQTMVKCRGIKDVHISAIAPDVSLAEFRGARVTYNDIKIVKQIGEGGFAKVYKAVWNDEIIALKQLTLDTGSTAEALGFEFEDAVDPLAVFAEFRREILLMSNMTHPNIVGLRGLCMEPFCMLLEFCSLGCLYDYIHDKERPMNWAVVLKLAKDIAEGMRFMHNFQPALIHRDLKSPNVLLSIAQSDAGYPTLIAKVADFGLSRQLMLAGQLKTKVVDNPVWLAPEMMRREEYDEKVDVYSFGVILWELVAREDFLGHITFLSAIEDAVLNGERPKIPDDCFATCPEYASLIERCWSGNATERPSFAAICSELEAMSERRLPATKATLPRMEIPTITDEPAGPSTEPARVTHSMPSMKYRQAARPLASVAPQPAKNSLAALDKGKNRVEPPRSIQTIVPGGAGGVKTGGGTAEHFRPAVGPRSPAVNAFQPTLLSSPSFASAGSQEVASIRATAGPDAEAEEASAAAAATEDFSQRVIEGTEYQTTLPTLSAAITCMAYLAGRVWTATADGKCQLWDAATAALLKEVQIHSASVTKLLPVANKEMWSCSVDNTVKIWSVDGQYVADARTQDQVYCMIEVPGPRGDTKAHSHVWGGTREINKRSTSIRFEIGCIHVWDAVNKKLKKTFKLAPPQQLTELLTMPVPLAMVYHSNHVWVASNPIILCFDPYTQACKGYLDFKGEVRTMVSVGKELWSGSTNTIIKVWNPQERGGDCVATLEGHGGEVVNFCTNGVCVWSCGWDKQVFLWDVQAHKFIKNLSREHKDSIASMTLVPLPSGQKQLWTGGKDCLTIVWK